MKAYTHGHLLTTARYLARGAGYSGPVKTRGACPNGHVWAGWAWGIEVRVEGGSGARLWVQSECASPVCASTDIRRVEL